jgi:uncharacterized protein (TIGR02145 family)
MKCTKYGGLYQWNEIMQYTTQNGTQGICPSGWHISTDEEWKVLEGSVDSQYGIGDPIWDNINYRGFDAGLNLKSTSGWRDEGNGTDLFDFSGLPGGVRHDDGDFYTIGEFGNYWTSTEYDSTRAWCILTSYVFSGISRSPGPGKAFGFSVRCMRDY